MVPADIAPGIDVTGIELLGGTVVEAARPPTLRTNSASLSSRPGAVTPYSGLSLSMM
jgi:hypothetical protein